LQNLKFAGITADSRISLKTPASKKTARKSSAGRSGSMVVIFNKNVLVKEASTDLSALIETS
jgi:hypothetical protein